MDKNLAIGLKVDSRNDQQDKRILLRLSTGNNWLQVLGSFFIFFNAWGIILAFGAFQTYYEQDLLVHDSKSSISWIGTTSAFFLILGGSMAGVFYDKGYSRVLLVTGSLLVVFGLMMVSLCHQYYQIFLAQGICVGIGTSLLWIPAMTVVAARFQTSIRAVAIGIVSSGSSIGGVVYPIMFRRLQPHVGFPWAVRIMAFVALGVFILALSFLLPPRPYKSPNARQLMDRTSFKDVPFLVFIFCGLPTLIGYFTPLVYLPTFVEASIPTNNRADIAFYILSVTNGASSFSRIGGGLVAAKFGPCGTYAFALASSSVLLFGWIGIKSLGGLIIWAILWGLTTGLIISMPGAIVPLLCPNHAVLGTRMGMTFLGAAVGILIGSPIGGKLIAEGSSAEPIWWPLQIFTALTMAMGALLMCYPWLCVSRKQRALKVNEDT